MDISKRARELSPDIINWRRTLHTFPETGNDTFRTAEYVREQLDAMGVSYRSLVNDCGVVALIGKDTGRAVALRTDMDGLPVHEMTGLPFASENGCMHACGHDSHAAMALGTAKILKEMEDELPGQVKIIFQPGEETITGAKAMIADGALEDPRPVAMIATHSMNVQGLENGSILVTHGVQSASSDVFEITVHGKGGHGGEPHKCIDVITTICRIVDALQCIRSREISATEDGLLSITGIAAGTDAYNVMPDSATIRGTYRTHSEEVRAFMTKRIREISEGIASSMRAEAEVNIITGIPSLYNDSRVVDIVLEAYGEVEDHKQAVEMPAHMGGEDAACYFLEVPGAYFMLNDTKANGGEFHPMHNCQFDLDDSVLYIGTETEVRSLIRLLEKFR